MTSGRQIHNRLKSGTPKYFFLYFIISNYTNNKLIFFFILGSLRNSGFINCGKYSETRIKKSNHCYLLVANNDFFFSLDLNFGFVTGEKNRKNQMSCCDNSASDEINNLFICLLFITT